MKINPAAEEGLLTALSLTEELSYGIVFGITTVQAVVEAVI